MVIQGVFVDDGAAGCVDKEGAGFEEGEIGGREDVVGAGREDELDGEDVGVGKEVGF